MFQKLESGRVSRRELVVLPVSDSSICFSEEEGALEASEALGKLCVMFSGDRCFEVSEQSPVRVSLSLAIAVS